MEYGAAGAYCSDHSDLLREIFGVAINFLSFQSRSTGFLETSSLLVVDWEDVVLRGSMSVRFHFVFLQCKF